MPARDLALLLAMCLVWAVNNILSKYVMTLGAPPMFYAAARFAILAVTLIPLLLPAPRPIWRLLVAAFLLGAGNFGLMFIGLSLATPSSVAIVSQVSLPFTVIFSVAMLGERIGLRRGVGIAMTFLGALLVMWSPQGLTFSVGLMFVVAAALMSSLGSVMTKQIVGIRPLAFQSWVGLTSLAPMAAFSAALEPHGAERAIHAGWPFLVALLFSAFIVSMFAHTTYVALLQRHEANLVAALNLLAPLMTIGLGVVLLNDPFGPRMALGGLLALAGVLVMILRPNQVMSLLMTLRSRP